MVPNSTWVTIMLIQEVMSGRSAIPSFPRTSGNHTVFLHVVLTRIQKGWPSCWDGVSPKIGINTGAWALGSQGGHPLSQVFIECSILQWPIKTGGKNKSSHFSELHIITLKQASINVELVIIWI